MLINIIPCWANHRIYITHYCYTKNEKACIFKQGYEQEGDLAHDAHDDYGSFLIVRAVNDFNTIDREQKRGACKKDKQSDLKICSVK